MKLIFVGNSQCEFIKTEFDRLILDKSDLFITYVNDHYLSNQSVEAIQQADAIILQERSVPISSDVEGLNKFARRYRIPEVRTDFLWPFGGQSHVMNHPEHRPPNGPFPPALGDAYLNRRIEARFSTDLLQEYAALRIDRLINLNAYRDSVLQGQKRIDAVLGSDWASVIGDGLSKRPVLSNPLHPAPWVVRQIIGQLLSEADLGISLADNVMASVSFDAPELPVHPSIASYFDLSWAAPKRAYKLRDGDRVSFAEYVRRYLAYAGGPELEIGLRAVSARSFDEAVANLRQAIAHPLGRGSVSAHYGLAVALAEMGENERASEALETARELDPIDTEIILTNARLLAKAGRPADAENELRRYFAGGGAELNAHVLLADVLLEAGKPGEGAQVLKAALEISGRNPNLQSRLTLALASAGSFEEAVESARTEIRLGPDNPHPQAYLVGLLLRLGQREAAKTQLERILTTIWGRPGLEKMQDGLRSLYRTLDPPLRDDLL